MINALSIRLYSFFVVICNTQSFCLFDLSAFRSDKNPVKVRKNTEKYGSYLHVVW